MSITLFCLVKENSTANAFSVKISNDELISELKKAVKAEKAPEFDHFPVDKLKLWNVSIPDDHDDLLSNLSLNDGDELLATREIGDYWTEKPPKRHIHVLVEPPVSTSASNEILELREKLTSLQALLNKSVHATKSIYSYTYFVSATYPFKDQVKVVPEKLIEGKNGRGNLDYRIESCTTGRIIGLVEVKKDDFKQ
ncbi:hypothetical protein RhiirC2_760490, partial [Rhizophagus irregularis]